MFDVRWCYRTVCNHKSMYNESQSCICHNNITVSEDLVCFWMSYENFEPKTHAQYYKFVSSQTNNWNDKLGTMPHNAILIMIQLKIFHVFYVVRSVLTVATTICIKWMIYYLTGISLKWCGYSVWESICIFSVTDTHNIVLNSNLTCPRYL